MTFMIQLQPIRPGQSVDQYLQGEQARLDRVSKLYKFVYYTLRILAALPAVLLPFVVNQSPILATSFAVLVAVVTVFDTILNPAKRWRNASRSSLRLFVEQIRERGEYDKYKGRLEELLKAEEEDAGLVLSLQETLQQIKAGPPQPPPPAPSAGQPPPPAPPSS